jgi:hypothetical protein
LYGAAARAVYFPTQKEQNKNTIRVLNLDGVFNFWGQSWDIGLRVDAVTPVRLVGGYM